MKTNRQPSPKSPSSQTTPKGSAFLGIALMLVSGFGFTGSILFASLPESAKQRDTSL